MIFYTYILYSASKDKYYIGHTADLILRLSQHNTTQNLGANDWKIHYLETFDTRAEAMKREKEIKNKKSRKYIEWLIHQND
jgi:putative endonuclease